MFNRSGGILLHITSLPSPYGIGDLGSEAFKFADFLKKSNQSLWQILPLGQTGFGDSPYQSFSAFAGNPIFISPEVLLKKGYLESNDLIDVPDFPSDKIDYSAVIPYKTKLFTIAFSRFQEISDNTILEKYENFCRQNSKWLDDYCLFCAIKDYFIAKRKNELSSPEFLDFAEKTKSLLSEDLQKDYYYGGVWSTWPAYLAKRNAMAISKISQLLKDKIQYYSFLQFEFFEQWNSLKTYVNSMGIKIIGDIPIFVAYDSADTWSAPKNFYLDENGLPTVVAGVPPDYFSEYGQLWGNPLYNWGYHKETHYAWWIERIRETLSFVDILRIDHFRGFDSFWAIPFGSKTAVSGKWMDGPGGGFFNALKNALGSLPIIAEDLGIITSSVTELRKNLGFPGMKVLQFAFDNSENNDHLPHNFNKNTVVYTGTHDNNTTVGWYLAASDDEKDLFRRYMNVTGANPSFDLIRLAAASCANISIYPMQDVLGLDGQARMNTPASCENNWQWRLEPQMITEDTVLFLSYITTLFKRC